MKIKTNFPLATVNTFQLGGPAKFYLHTTQAEEAVSALIIAKQLKMPYYLLSGGSNTVFADKGFPGLVIHFFQPKPSLRDLKIVNSRIIVSAGVSLMDLVKFASQHGLAGLEKLAGIPGCVGGAVAGNAGAYGQDIGQRVEWVEIFDGNKIRRLNRTACFFRYRQSLFKKKTWLILMVGFKLKPGLSQTLKAEVKRTTRIRWKKFGVKPVSAGSFFKNVIVADLKPSCLKKIDQSRVIEGRIPTGYLLGEAGSAGLSVGGIRVSSFHHNFLLNDGTGTTRDLVALTTKMKKLVYQKFGLELEAEVQLVL